MKQYHDLLNRLLAKRLHQGTLRDNRTDTKTTALFCETMRWDLSKGFPLITTKKVNFNAIAHELLWFLSGDTNIRYLLKNNVHIWSEWPHKRFNESVDPTMSLVEFEKLVIENDECTVKYFGKHAVEQTETRFGDHYGDLGPVYGHQWRRFGESLDDLRTTLTVALGGKRTKGFDQIKWVQNEIKTNPTSRRLIVNSWNPKDTQVAALPPCHLYFQFFVEDGKLSCFFLMRSVDVFLGLPFNIASYALLTHMMAQACGLEVGELSWQGVDCHLYENHTEQAALQLLRSEYELPTLKINGDYDNILDIPFEAIELVNYQHHPFLGAPVAV